MDIPDFSTLLQDLLVPHESLRTRFVVADGVGAQQILSADALPRSLDVHSVTADTLPAALDTAARYCFDLSREIRLRPSSLLEKSGR